MRRFRLSLLFLLAALSLAVPAVAQPRSGANASAEDQKKAQEHFHKARDLYSSGRYGDALAELEIARRLDPKAKDLVMNLGIVSEKLAKYDEAIAWFNKFLEMDDVSPSEKSRAEGFIRRIEGAKKEHGTKAPPPTPPASASTAAPPPSVAPTTTSTAPKAATEPEPGRVDAATVAAGVVAGVGLAAGATFGIIALTGRPSNFVTGVDGSYADLESKTANAHTMAIVADIGFGVGVVAAVAALYLYFGRPKDPGQSAISAFTPRGLSF